MSRQVFAGFADRRIDVIDWRAVKTPEDYAREYCKASGMRPTRNNMRFLSGMFMTMPEERIIVAIRRARITEAFRPIAEAENWSEERLEEVVEFEMAWGDDPDSSHRSHK